MNTQEALNIERSAQQIMQEDPVGFRLKAIRRLALEGDGSHHLTDILLKVANLAGHTREEIYASERFDRVLEDAAWLNICAEEEAIIYARNEQELANKTKAIFFPEETGK